MTELNSATGTVRPEGEAAGSPRSGEFVPAPVRWLLWFLCIAWLFYAAWVVFGPGFGTELRDTYTYDCIEILATAMVFLRVVAHRRDRLAWVLIGFALACWTAGDILYDTVVQYQDPMPWPSIADPFYLALYPCILAALVLLLWRRVGRAPIGVWLDALLVALGVGAYAWMAVADLFAEDSETQVSTAAMLTSAAYPVGDFITLSVIVGVMAVLGWPRAPMWWLLVGGCLLFAFSDTSYFIRVAADEYQPGSLLDLGWPTSIVLIALAAWIKPARPRPDINPARAIVVPAFVMIAVFGLVLYGDAQVLPTVSIALAAGAIVIGAVRALQVFRRVSVLAGIKEQSLTDPLTGLGNRRLLDARLDEVIAARESGQQVRIVQFNIDGFRDVNETFGHAVGDALLCQVGERLGADLGPADTLVRLSGDEFAVLMAPGARAADAEAYLRRVERRMTRAFKLADLEVVVAIRAGVAVCPDHAETSEGLLRCVDAALARARIQRGGFVMFDPSLDGGEKGQLRTIQELREGIRRHELICFYQPKLDLRDDQIHAAETLVRWAHPELGMIYPDSFLPLAERAGLMRPLTEEILDVGLAQAAEWRELGLDISVAVNLSMTNLLDLGLPETVERLLRKHDLSPEALVLEVTETMVMADPERAQAVVNKLHRLGIALSVDDYGKGYSSLSQLRNLSAQEIKLDRAFVTGLAHRPELHSIVRSTVALAHDLGIEMVAEGIETAADLAEIRRLGCDIAQGYFIRRPGPSVEITEWLLQRRRAMESTEVITGGPPGPVAGGPAGSGPAVDYDAADEHTVPRPRHGPLRTKPGRRSRAGMPPRGRRA